VSVQAAQSSITRGKTATYTVQVSTKNGSASNVSVALTSQPSSQKPEFTSGCTKGTASCTVASITTAKPANLGAQIAVASSATSVTSVKLTATASVTSTAKWTPPAAAGTTAVISAAATKSSHSSATASPSVSTLPVLPGLIPNLNAEASMLVGAGNAAGLFPAITPSAGPGASQAAQPQGGGRQNADPITNVSTVSSGTQVLTAQVAGLIALGLAIMLTVTRLSLRKRSGSSGSSGSGS
jgi:hypothetical protein